MNYINLKDIHFPVYKLGKHKPYLDKGKVYYTLHSESDDSEQVRIVDDTTINKPTLAERRLKLKITGIKLSPLKYAIFFIGDLIKMAKKGIWFIDNTGKIFTFNKEKKTKLLFRKIVKRFVNINNGNIVVEVEGIPIRFESLYGGIAGEIYAGILEFDKTYILYGFYNKKYKDTWRKI